MQPIHRTSCQDMQPSSSASLAGYLARLIDGQVRARMALAAGAQGPDPAGTPRPANALIWVEDDAAPEHATPEHAMSERIDEGHASLTLPSRSRGMIVVAHHPGQNVAERSFVISFPVGAKGGGQRVPAVSAMLARLGWSILSFRRQRTAPSHANTAVLVSMTPPDLEQRLWLAEPPVPGARTPAIPAQAGLGRHRYSACRLHPSQAASSAGAALAVQGMRGKTKARANDGGPDSGILG